MKKSTKKRIRTTEKHAPAADIDPRFAPVVDAFIGDRRVTYGKLFASMGLKVNGKIFAMVVKGKLVAKLPRNRATELVGLGKGDYFNPGHGRPMKEWVALKAETESWVDLAREAHRYVKGGKA